MRRKIPSSIALTAFEAAARHQSYSKAADELAVTQSAVCRQIAALEEFLGVPLFRRSHRGVTLTEAGADYAHRVRLRLHEVERDAVELMSYGGTGDTTLELGLVPTFASRWLLPRLSAFAQAHPGICVNLSARPRPFLFDEAPFDAAIHPVTSPWRGAIGELLMEESLVPVCSPALADGRRHFGHADWPRLTLLHLSTRPYLWREWFEANDQRVAGDLAGPRLELFSMLTEAAMAGLGVALIPPLLIQDELARGRLVTMAERPWLSGCRYELIYPKQNSGSAALRTFAGWICAAARETPLGAAADRNLNDR